MTPKRTSVIAYLAVFAITALVVVVLPATGVLTVPALPVATGNTHEARVVEVLEDGSEQTGGGTVRRQRLRLEVAGTSEEIDHVFVEDSASGFALGEGDQVLVTEAPAGAPVRYQIVDRVRRAPVWALSLAFALLVVAVGGRQGAFSLAALAISFLVIVRFIVPGIYSGWDPVLTAVLGALVIMASSLVIGHGPHPKTWIALGGTTISLALTAVLAQVAVRVTHLTGYGDEGAATLGQLAGGIDARGLLLGGIIIGALGVLDDVTTTQASTVLELRRANPALDVGELFARAMNVGRDHIAATTNTLVLAYAGASLPLLMILAGQSEPLGILVSYETLTTEVVRTLVGSIGIVAAVPITTALAAALLGRGLVGVPPEDEGEPVF